MQGGLLADNWLFQEVGQCLHDGLSADTYSEVMIDIGQDSHSLRDVPAACIQISALVSLLVEIVLRDVIVVDEKFVTTWSDTRAHFLALTSGNLVRAVPFLNQGDRLREPTKIIVNQLCATSTLRHIQGQNEVSWAKANSAHDPYMSAVLWGAAGMLSRSHVFEVPYSGHPLRKRIIEQAVMRQPTDVVSHFSAWIEKERLRIFETHKEGAIQRQATLILPPVVIDIIEEATDPKQLLSTALQVREKYSKLREWLRTIESAMESEDPKAISKYQRTLELVAKDVSRAVGPSDIGQVSARIGFDYPSVNINLGTFDGVLKRFGTRAMLNKIVFAKQGEKSLGKLLRMFGESRSSGVGLSVINHLLRA